MLNGLTINCNPATEKPTHYCPKKCPTNEEMGCKLVITSGEILVLILVYYPILTYTNSPRLTACLQT